MQQSIPDVWRDTIIRWSVTILRGSGFDEPDDHIDVADPHALRRLRQTVDADRIARNIYQFALMLDVKMVVVRCIGIEIAALAVDRQLA